MVSAAPMTMKKRMYVQALTVLTASSRLKKTLLIRKFNFSLLVSNSIFHNPERLTKDFHYHILNAMVSAALMKVKR
jgi:hypothetical protein